LTVRHNTSLKAIAICAMLASVTACVDPDQRSDTSQSALILPPMMNTRPATFKCEEIGVVVVRPVGEDGAAITLATRGKDVPLKTVPADQGRKYSDGTTVFWMNGDNATLFLAGREEAETCERR
jgi:membrane-bound inhibitor of C-type lysozyme